MITIFFITDLNGISKYVLLFSFLHELGHFVVLVTENIVPQKIKFSISGISIDVRNDIYFLKKIAVFSAGFITNYILSIVYFFMGNKTAFLINLIIGLFTMYPLPSTDGGSIMREILLLFDDLKNGLIISIIETVFEVVFSLIIILSVILTKNYYLFSALFYLVVCILNY